MCSNALYTEPATESPQGMLFDVLRYSLHDGPGIRTTAFLKGCPLHCVWCHNPESQNFQPEISFNQTLCRSCGSCRRACNVAAGDSNAFDRHLCNNGDAAVRACPFGALEIRGRQWTVRQVMQIVLSDRDYYQRTGGGLTISGGEPLTQLQFVAALLEAARAENIHTCLETCGHIGFQAFQRILPLTDLFLFDYKATDPDAHRRWTGVDNRLILENLDRLCTAGARILIRCPLVPQLNDTPDHLAAIAGLSRRTDVLGVEVLPFHNTGQYKYDRLGYPGQLGRRPSATPEDLLRWKQVFSSMGAIRIRIS